MKKVLITFIAMTLPMLASAETVEIDGIWYNLINKINEAEVTRPPKGGYSGNIEIPTSVTYNEVKYSVTSIGERAFYFYVGLTSVTIPNSVKSIGFGAFSNCDGLTSVTIPNSVTSIGRDTFNGCHSLTSVTIPNSVTSIGEQAFSYCSSLTSITIPNSVTSIGSYAFNGCSGLTFVTIPSSVTSIEGAAFCDCSGLTSVTIPNSVTFIGGSAFSGCRGLTSVTIPNSVTFIGGSAFSGCNGLTSVTIPNSVTTIGDYAFYRCRGLTSVIIPNSVTSINGRAFANCDDLTDVYCLSEIISDNDSWGHEGLYISPDAFQDSYPQYIILHVPASAINVYKTTEPWNGFKAIVTLEDGDIPETLKCATPFISIENGKVKFNCETEGVEFVSSISTPDAKNYYDSELTLSYKYMVSVYATKTGYENSETATREIVITENGKAILVGDVDGDGQVNVADHVKLSEIIMNKK